MLPRVERLHGWALMVRIHLSAREFYAKSVQHKEPTAMSKLPIFDPKDLRPVRELIAAGILPYHPKTAERFCREGVLPAMKIGNSWCTTPAAIRQFFWNKGNKSFRKLSV